MPRPHRRRAILLVSVICLIYAALMACGITCPILAVTGIACPGCGMTRAWLSLLRGDFGAAFRFHPLFPLPAVLLVLFCLRRRIRPRVMERMLLVLLILTLLVWLIRFFLEPGRFSPATGLIGRLVGRLLESV